MSFTFPKAPRRPVLELTLPTLTADRLAIIRNASDGRRLALNLPHGFGGTLSLDFAAQQITDADGVDRSGFLDASLAELWEPVPLPPGSTDLAVEIDGGAVVVTEDFNQSAGALNGQGVGALAASSGPRLASVGADDASIGSKAWGGTLAQISAEDGQGPTVTLNGVEISHYLVATGFGFAIPSGATITGIKFEVKRASAFRQYVKDAAVRAVKGGVIGTTDRALIPNWPSAQTWAAYGGAADLWGSSWLYSDINAANFGVAIAARGWNFYGTLAGLAGIDAVRATVYYTTASGTTWATSGDATDLTVEAIGHTAQRAEISDAAGIQNGRLAVTSAAGITGQRSKVDFKWSAAAGANSAVLLRHTDALNLACAYVTPAGLLVIEKRVGGSTAVLEQVSVPVPPVSTYRTLQADAFADGRVRVDYGPQGAPVIGAAEAAHADLATGGGLASGKPGFADHKTDAVACTRNYDGYRAYDLSAAAIGATAVLHWTEGAPG